MADMVVVFSDIDGTLIDHFTYSHAQSMPGVSMLKERGYPLVLVSSKTFPEIKTLHDELDLDTPFVFENGGGIAWPGDVHHQDFKVELRGMDVSSLRFHLAFLRSLAGSDIVLLEDMPVEEIAQRTGLSRKAAKFARHRQASLPFVIDNMDRLSQKDIEVINATLQKKGLVLTRGGRFFHFSSAEANKGSAVAEITESIKRKNMQKQVRTAGIGDSMNDLPMLEAVDTAYLVENQHGSMVESGFPVVRTSCAGPAGFSEAVGHICHKEHELL